MKSTAKKLAVCAAAFCLLACGTAVSAAAASPVSGLALSGITMPWDQNVPAESIEAGSYTANMLLGSSQQLSPVVRPRNSTDSVVYISDDTSILTVLNLVSLGVPKVIAEAASAEHGEILEKLGAEVVYPERDIAIRLAHRLETSKILDYVQLSEKVNISKMLVPESLVGKTVLEANLRKQFGVNIIAIENHAEVLRNVGPAYAFRKGDVLFLAGDKSGLNGLLEWAEKQ